jgi:hypothetical protein
MECGSFTGASIFLNNLHSLRAIGLLQTEKVTMPILLSIQMQLVEISEDCAVDPTQGQSENDSLWPGKRKRPTGNSLETSYSSFP